MTPLNEGALPSEPERWWDAVEGGPAIQTAEAPGTEYPGTPQELIRGFKAILRDGHNADFSYLDPLDGAPGATPET